MASLTSTFSALSSVTFHGSITFVPRITLAWPAIIDAVRYLRNQANLANETDRDLETEMNWDHTQTFLIPVLNDFCVRKLLRQLPEFYQNEVHGDARVLKVEIFDPKTHKLIGSSDQA